jgi:hypothetical protein
MNPATVRAQVVTSRRAQGLTDHVTAGRVLDQLAAEVLDHDLAQPSTPERHERVRANDEETAA